MRKPQRIWASYIAVTVAAPAVVTAIGMYLQWSWLPELPTPVAIHWSGGGPDGFGPAWQTLLATGGLGFALPVLLSVLLMPSITRGTASTGKTRFMAATCLWTSLFIVGLLTSTLGVQRGLSDAAHAPDVGGWLVVSLVAATAISAACGYAIPKLSTDQQQ